MKGLDSNVLLRYILEDDPVWTKPATRFIDVECTRDNPGYINFIVLAEVVWTLRRQPHIDRDRLSVIIGELLEADNFQFENEDIVKAALKRFLKYPAGLTDCLIAEINAAAEVEATYSIDKDGARSDIFRPIPKVVMS